MYVYKQYCTTVIRASVLIVSLVALLALPRSSWSGSVAPVAATRSRTRPPLPASTIGALLVAYRNPKAVYHVLASYRAHYPEGDLVVACDDGCHNYSALCAHFGAVWLGTPRRIASKHNPGWFMTNTHVAAFVDVLHEALPHIRSRFFFHLETDVRIERRVASGLHFALNGAIPLSLGYFVGGERAFAVHYNPAFVAWAGSGFGYTPHEPRPPYGGQGGAIISATFWRRILSQPAPHLENDLAFFFDCMTTTGVDYFYSAFTYRYNGTVGPYDGFETAHDGRLYPAVGVAEVTHPDKSFYAVPLVDEELAALTPAYVQTLAAPDASADTYARHNCGATPMAANYTPRLGSTGLEADYAAAEAEGRQQQPFTLF